MHSPLPKSSVYLQNMFIQSINVFVQEHEEWSQKTFFVALGTCKSIKVEGCQGVKSRNLDKRECQAFTKGLTSMLHPVLTQVQEGPISVFSHF